MRRDLDGFLLTPLGIDKSCRGLGMAAREGDYGGAPPPGASLVAYDPRDRNWFRNYALVSLHAPHAHTGRLDARRLVRARAFAKRHRRMLVKHWMGRLSSLELLDAVSCRRPAPWRGRAVEGDPVSRHIRYASVTRHQLEIVEEANNPVGPAIEVGMTMEQAELIMDQWFAVL